MRLIRQCFSAFVLMISGFQGMAAASPVQPHHSALWYDPARDGEGFVLEVYADDHALLTWYTYDDDGNQRWLTGLGSVVVDDAGNEQLHFPEMLAPRGGRFGPDFDPAQVERVPAGEIILRFDDCWRGELTYTVFGDSGRIPVQRLTRTMGANCGPIHGTTGEPVQPYAGQSGAWYDPAHDGEGWLLQWMAEDEAIVTWFTYTPQGAPFWLVGTGKREGDTIVFPQLHSTRGARFGDAFDPDDVERIEWGQLELTLDCDAGTMRYESTISDFGSGGLDNMLHLTRLAQPACPWVPPTLSDLYQVTTIPLFLEDDASPDINVFPLGIANDGTVLAEWWRPREYRQSMIWRSGDESWQELPSMNNGGSYWIAHDSGAVFVFDWLTKKLMKWDGDDGWSTLPGQADVDNADLWVSGSSSDGSQWLGQMSVPGGGWRPWVWSAEYGRFQMPGVGNFPEALFNAISNDGRIAVGQSSPFVHNTFGQQRPISGLLWRDPSRLNHVFDSRQQILGRILTCSADCNTFFGTGLLWDPLDKSAWYATSSGRFGYLDEIVPLPENTWFWTEHNSADGSLVVGLMRPDGVDDAATIWTQDLGLVSLREFMPVAATDSETVSAYRARVSADGRWILMVGKISRPGSGQRDWASVLHLQPKASAGH